MIREGKVPQVLVLGGGIAGLSVAMELVSDCEVTILERRQIAGGKARTWTDPDYGVFREHSFRVFHDTYYNTFDTMRRVPLGDGRTIRQNLVRFVTREELEETGENTFKRWLDSALDGKDVTTAEKLRIARDALRLLRALCACDARLRDRYSDATFADIFVTRPDGSKGLVFQGLADMSQVEYSADRVNPDVKIMLNFMEKHFMHGMPGIQWNALAGPTSDTFIEPWKRHVVERGVEFRANTEVVDIEIDKTGEIVGGVRVRDTETGEEQTLHADFYVSALPTDDLLRLASKELLIGAPTIARLGEVRRVWNNGVIIYTSKKTRFLGGYYMWHPWRVAVTTYADRWTKDFDIAGYGVGESKGKIRDIISYVITDWHATGIRVTKKASDCTPDEIYEELCYMSLEDSVIMPEFDPADHVHPTNANGDSVRCLVDASLVYDPGSGRIVVNEDTLAHLPPGGSFRMPGADTELENLKLAGCHCYNEFGCGDSMEGANETGRRAANSILEAAGVHRRAQILKGRTSSRQVKVLKALRRLDAMLYRLTRS